MFLRPKSRRHVLRELRKLNESLRRMTWQWGPSANATTVHEWPLDPETGKVTMTTTRRPPELFRENDIMSWRILKDQLFSIMLACRHLESFADECIDELQSPKKG